MDRDLGSTENFQWKNARAVARARVILAFGNVLVLYLDPSLPPCGEWRGLLAAYGTVSLILAYSLWMWWQERSAAPSPCLPRIANWLDVLFSAALIWSTGAHKSPFYIWNVFTIVGSALKSGWWTAVRVCAAEIVLYFGICLPNLGRPDFILGAFFVRTLYLFVIALVLAHMGQRLLEQNRMLAGLHRAATYLSAGCSTGEILARLADSLTDLLEAEQVAVATWDARGKGTRSVFGNLDREQGERLLHFARTRMASAAPVEGPFTLVHDEIEEHERAAREGNPLAGVRNLLITRLPSSGEGSGALIACNQSRRRGFLHSERELAELLAAQAGPLLETARLQEQRRYYAGVDERHRIAAELHDRLIQTLASMDLCILTCSDLWREGRWEPLGQELNALKRLAVEALEEAREAVTELAPVRLREEGLAAHLEACVRRFQVRAGRPVEVSLDLAQIQVPEPTALLLIGLLREGLNNVRKHARASRVTIVVAQSGDRVTFRLTDDGIGFRPAECLSLRARTRHYGLTYLRERVAAMGGELDVISAPGEGAVLQATVPILDEERLVSRLRRTSVQGTSAIPYTDVPGAAPCASTCLDADAGGRAEA